MTNEFELSPDKVQVTYESGEMEPAVHIDHKFKNPYLLYVGNAHPHKNLDRLLEAFKLLHKDFPKLKLVLIGRLDYFYERLAQTVEKMDLQSSVHFPGEVSNGDLAMWYKRALLFVFPSLAEGFGIPGLEAMQFGCPVVVSDIAVFHEIYGEAAVYFDPESTTEIKKQLQAIVTDTKLRQKLVEKGYQKSRTYSWERMAAETLHIYDQVVDFREKK